jgi:type II secretory pathway component PulF
MAKTATVSRRHRRAQLSAMGYLKIKNQLSPLSPEGIELRNSLRANSKAAKEAFEKKIMDQIEEQLGQKAESLKETWTQIGYNEAEIEMLSEAFSMLSIKNKQTLREDKKAAKNLMKQAKDSLTQRLNANS